MDEESFHSFYSETARGLRAYLRHKMGDSQLADDLLQESYMRLLGAALPRDMDPLHRKNYLYRIATNLTHDARKARQFEPLTDEGSTVVETSIVTAQDVRRVLTHLKQKERDLLWLAYVEGFSHAEIARVVQSKVASIRPMLARARAQFLRVMARTQYQTEKVGAKKE